MPATLEIVSASPDGTPTPLGARDVSLSDDGRYAVFVSTDPTLVEGDTNGVEDVFVRDRAAQTTVRVSVGSDGTQANGGSFVATISGDGRVVAFVSEATNLVPGDTNGMRDVFVRDLVNARTARVNVAADGSQSEIDPLKLGATLPSLSRDGRLVAFSSAASDLVPSDTNGWFDVFVKDRQTGIITRESVADDRAQADGPSMNGAISADGRSVVFDSWAGNLVTGDANHLGDVFVRDRALSTTRLVNVSTGGVQANGVSGAPRISADGRIVVFWSTATNLVVGDTDPVGDIFIRDRATNRTARLHAAANPFGAGTYALAANGRFIAYSTFVEGTNNGCDDVFVYDRATNLAARVSIREEDGQPGSCSREPALSADGRVVAFEGGQLLRHDAVAQQVFSLDLDSDSDTMPDAWESAFGLDPLHPGYAGADSDGDGVTNVGEFVAASHPRATVARYFAEGAVSSLFDARFALLNPGEVPIHALLTFQSTSGDTRAQAVTIAPHARATIDAGSVVDLDGWEFSTLVESDGEIVADRLMRWDRSGYGSHLETSIAEPSLAWYFAEGATHSELELFYLLQNPHPSASAAVEVTFLRPIDAFPEGPSRIVRTYTIAPHSRLNIWVNLVDPLLARCDVSASIRVTNAVPILAERALYQDVPHWDPVTGAALGAQVLGAGTVAAGATAAATTWYLAEGATGWLDEFVLIANPGDVAAAIDVQFLLSDGTTVAKTYVVDAASRFTIWVNQVEVSGVRPLAATAHATVVTSTNGVPVIVERAMWWPSTRSGWWEEGHSVVGATVPGRVWACAEGEVGGVGNSETYILVASLGTVPGAARVTLMFEDGTTATKDFALPAHSRVNVQVAHEFPEAVGRRFGAVVESLLPDAVPILVERSMYSDAGGVHWAAGAAAMATVLRP